MTEDVKRQVTSLETTGDDLAELLTSILESMDGIQDRLEAIQETQAEVIEKLDNLGLPGGSFEVGYDS